MIAAGLAVLWALLNAVDLGETLYGLSLGHVEQNPLASAALDAAGTAGLVGYKLALAGVVLWALRRAYLKRPRFTVALLVLGNVIIGAVVIHNAAVLEIV